MEALLDVMGDQQTTRAQRLLIARLTNDEDLARTVRHDLWTDPRGNETALVALALNLAEYAIALIEATTGKGRDEIAAALRDGLADIVFKEGMSDDL